MGDQHAERVPYDHSQDHVPDSPECWDKCGDPAQWQRHPESVAHEECMLCLGEGWVFDDDPYQSGTLIGCPTCFGAGTVRRSDDG